MDEIPAELDPLTNVEDTFVEAQAAPKRDRLGWKQGVAAVLAGVVLLFIGNLLVAAIGAAVIASRNGEVTENAMAGFVTSLVGLGAGQLANFSAFFVVAVLAPIIAKVPHRDVLGLRQVPWFTYPLAALGMLTLGPTSDLLARGARAVGVPGGEGLEAIEGAIHGQPFWVLWPILAVLPAVGEEIAFRGLLQRSIRNPAIAITASAIGFSLLHLDLVHIIGVVPLGFYLAFLGHRTGSLYVPIFAHLMNNTMAVVATQLTGQMDTSEVTPLWVAPVGWVLCAAFSGVLIVMLRKHEARFALATPATAPASRP